MAAGRSAGKPPRNKKPGGKTPGGKTPGGKNSGGKNSGGKNPGSKKPSVPKAGHLVPGAAQRSSDAASRLPTGPFRLGAIEGATPGKWIDVWKDRYPGVPLELVPLTPADQAEVMAAASVDAALVRLPIPRAGLHVIPLYEEVPVVVCAAESHLTAADELTLADLDGEVVITPAHPPLALEVPGSVAPRFAAPPTVADAIALAATGVGVVVVPLSLARAHHRKDAAHRPLTDGPHSTVALVWPDAGPTPPLVDAFVGIVRGRTANSSR
ncbi:LysR substrate-binding domain-containing protein [Microbacterium flavum]|uniref:LysR substrate-binding domain-containing protein n=1 Tax=Microbacterium flavum TaxID=415216 RepID=UPI0024ACD753|nr:LysR substrate-binding domain-containing protein [Microbacterium flavum]